jgi:hypothetical protein
MGNRAGGNYLIDIAEIEKTTGSFVFYADIYKITDSAEAEIVAIPFGNGFPHCFYFTFVFHPPEIFSFKFLCTK